MIIDERSVVAMEPQSKRARTDAAAAASPSENSAQQARLSDGSPRPIDALPNALLERIFREHLGVAEAWRTAHLTCRKWRQLAEEIEWCELKARGTRPAAFEALETVVRGGRLRLLGGAAGRRTLTLRSNIGASPSEAPMSTHRSAQAARSCSRRWRSTRSGARRATLCGRARRRRGPGGLRHVGVGYDFAALVLVRVIVLPRFEREGDHLLAAIGRLIASPNSWRSRTASRTPSSAPAAPATRDLLFLRCTHADTWQWDEDWELYQAAVRRLLAAAAPVLRSATVVYEESFWQIGDRDVDVVRARRARLRECLRAAGPLGEEIAGPVDHGPQVRWRRAESAALSASPR
eukprot:tig00021127_g18822.t2